MFLFIAVLSRRVVTPRIYTIIIIIIIVIIMGAGDDQLELPFGTVDASGFRACSTWEGSHPG